MRVHIKKEFTVNFISTYSVKKTIELSFDMNFFIILLTFASLEPSIIARTAENENESGIMIVGGTEARQGQFPYQLEIIERSYHLCGASLVQVSDLQIAITASHCVYESYPEDYTLIAGELDRSETSGAEQTRQVSKVVRHPYNNSEIFQYDISILFFNEPFQLNNNVKTISLPEKYEEVNVGSNLTVSGWGLLSNNGQSPNVLQFVKIPVVSYAQCNASWSQDQADWSRISERHLCAGESTGTLSPCHGDSGGPAVSESGYLAGIVSWTKDCGHKDYPGVFTKVSHFIDWIEETVEIHLKNL